MFLSSSVLGLPVKIDFLLLTFALKDSISNEKWD